MDYVQQGFDVKVLNSMNPLWFLTLIPIALLYVFLSSATGYTAINVNTLPALFNPYYGIEWIPGPLFNTLVKIPLIIADIGTALILYRLLKRFSKTELTDTLVSLYYLNPMLIWISSAWGQNDSIPSLFTIFSLYLLLDNKTVYSALSLLLATLFKLYPVIFILPVFIYLLKKKNKKALITYLLVFITPLVILLLLSGERTIDNLFITIFSHFTPINTFYDIFGFGLTYWSWSMIFPMDPYVWAPVTILIMVALLGTTLMFVLKSKFDDPLRSLMITTFLVSASFFLSMRLVNEDRFVWLLPIIVLMMGERIVSLKSFGLVSLVAFIYTQKNFPYYLLPVATLNKNVLLPLFYVAAPFGKVVQGILLPTSIGAFILATIGTVFSILLLSMYIRGLRELKPNKSSNSIYICEPDKVDALKIKTGFINSELPYDN